MEFSILLTSHFRRGNRGYSFRIDLITIISCGMIQWVGKRRIHSANYIILVTADFNCMYIQWCCARIVRYRLLSENQMEWRRVNTATRGVYYRLTIVAPRTGDMSAVFERHYNNVSVIIYTPKPNRTRSWLDGAEQLHFFILGALKIRAICLLNIKENKITGFLSCACRKSLQAKFI